MVTAKTQYNLANAREYFEEHLCVGDYYDEGQRATDEWIGLGTERNGLDCPGKSVPADKLRLRHVRRRALLGAADCLRTIHDRCHNLVEMLNRHAVMLRPGFTVTLCDGGRNTPLQSGIFKLH